MDDIAAGRLAFGYTYECINLIRLVQWDRADPDNVRKLIADAARDARTIFPGCEAGIDAAVRDYEGAITRGLQLREERLRLEAVRGETGS